MATIAQALTRGILHDFRMPDHDGRAPRRPLYIADCFYDWVDNETELQVPNWHRRHGRRTRHEHLVQALGDFCCDARPLVGELNRVQPTRDGIWKIQPHGSRVFGWCPAPHAFVAVYGALDTETHGPGNSVNQLRLAVIAFAKQHALHETILRGDRSEIFPPPA